MWRAAFLRRVDEARVRAAIEAAERRTSGEVVVSVSRWFWGDVRVAAEKAFDRLKIADTAERNGVLLFLVPSRRQFVVLGDAGIHARVGDAFWEAVAAAISAKLRAGDVTGALVDGVTRVGEGLAEHFPHAGDKDRNELSDAVDRGR